MTCLMDTSLSHAKDIVFDYLRKTIYRNIIFLLFGRFDADRRSGSIHQTRVCLLSLFIAYGRVFVIAHWKSSSLMVRFVYGCMTAETNNLLPFVSAIFDSYYISDTSSSIMSTTSSDCYRPVTPAPCLPICQPVCSEVLM